MENKENYKILIGLPTFGEVDPRPLDKLIKFGFEIVKNPFSRKLKKEINNN